MSTPETQQTSQQAALQGLGRIFGSGEMYARTCAYDWASSSLGPVDEWSEALLVLVNMLLANQQPMCLLWGEDLLQFYNDAAIVVLEPDKHPAALGQPAHDCWPEVWSLLGPEIEKARGGEACWREDQLIPIFRHGRMEDAWFTYSFSPVRDGEGQVAGVLVTYTETTGRVLTDQALEKQREHLYAVFEQAPGLFALLRGPDHVFEMANHSFLQLVGGRDILGKPMREVVPEMVGQGYIGILDRVLRSGQSHSARDQRFVMTPGPQQGFEQRYLDYVCEPLREADGSVSGIMMLGVDITERRRATEALLDSQRGAAMVLESITDGFHLIDAQGRFQQFNPVGREIYRAQGMDADALVGKAVLEVFPELAETEIGRAVFTALRERRPTVVESHYTPWNRWFSVRNYPTPDGGVATFFQDFTEHKLTEMLLRDERERLNFATDAAHIGYWFCDLPFDKLNWDDRAKEHFWLPPDAEVNMDKFYAILHPDDRERTRQAIENSIERRERYDVEYRTVSPWGEEKWIHATGRTAYDDAGTPIRFDGVTQDVTALRQAKEDLDAESRRLNAVFENVPVGLLFVGTDGRIVNRNRHAEQILGHTARRDGIPENFLNWPMFHGDTRPVSRGESPLVLALKDGGIHRAELYYQRNNGSRTWLEVTSAPIRDSKGRMIGAVIALAGIDARRRAQEALIRTEKLAVVGRLATTISHEINNPLEAVTNLLYLIQNNSKDEEASRFSRIALEELSRVSHIVTHTLRFNRQSYGAARENLSELIEASLAIYLVRLRNSEIHVERDYRETERVLCAGSELRQVFANLIGNAFDATKSGGQLWLRTRNRAHACTGEAGVRITIADSGQGMDETTRKRLFEPFFTTKGDNGTGLGLWVSREILIKHRGTIRIKTRPSESGRSGTVISLWIPLSTEGEQADD